MTSDDQFQRARAPEAKRQREQAILEAARRLASDRSVRDVTLTDVAGVVGMHKSSMLRYFETREQIFLTIAAQEWQEWSAAVRGRLSSLTDPTPAEVAATLTDSLMARPLFCDLLVHTPLNLERNVSMETVREFKVQAIAAHGEVVTELQRLFSLGEAEASNVATVATSMAGALRQMAEPGPRLHELYRTDPELSHAIVEVPQRLRSILTALITGLSQPSAREAAASSVAG
jgi:AcrR family transcriptional regulator